MLHNLQFFHFNIHLLSFIFLLLSSSIMRIDDLFIISLYLFEHRIQSFRKVIQRRRSKQWRKKRSERSEDQLNVVFFRSVIELCWLHHRFTSINVISNEDQSIDRNRNETSEVKINSTLCFLDLLLNYADYIINLHR